MGFIVSFFEMPIVLKYDKNATPGIWVVQGELKILNSFMPSCVMMGARKCNLCEL